jgi:hypothetical protein
MDRRRSPFSPPEPWPLRESKNARHRRHDGGPPHGSLGLTHCCLGQIEGDLIVGRVDHQQQIAIVHELIVDDRQLDDAAQGQIALR